MEAINHAIEGAADFRGFMDKIMAAEKQAARQAAQAERGCSVIGNPPAIDEQRQPGENRAQHRARLKRQRREVKRTKAAA